MLHGMDLIIRLVQSSEKICITSGLAFFIWLSTVCLLLLFASYYCLSLTVAFTAFFSRLPMLTIWH